MKASRIVLLGAGGHARVLLDAMRTAGDTLPECALDAAKHGTSVDGVQIVGGDDMLPDLVKDGVTKFLLGMGGSGNATLRPRLWESATHAGLKPHSVIHPRAIVSPLAQLGEGAQVLAGAVINAGAIIGRGVIVNTAAVVEHDCVIGDFCHLAPRCCLGGGVQVGERCHIGLGVVVREYLSIGRESLVGAGAAVVCDLPANCRALGVPAKWEIL